MSFLYFPFKHFRWTIVAYDFYHNWECNDSINNHTSMLLNPSSLKTKQTKTNQQKKNQMQKILSIMVFTVD